MTRPTSSVNRIFLYRITAPILFLPWVWTQFFASAISWGLIALYSVWNWNSTIYYIPLISLGVFFVLAPFQESQEPIINILDLITENIDDFVNDILLPAIEDVFYIIQPGCWAYNFLWDGSVAIFRIAIYDPIAQLLRMIIPTNPFNFFETIEFAATAFPVTTEIDTTSAPDWIVGPYGRSLRGQGDDPRDEKHPLLDGSRRVDPTDPAAAALVRWLTKQQQQQQQQQSVGGLANHRVKPGGVPNLVRLVIDPNVLDRWTHPGTRPEERRAISEQLLRQEMDRSMGLEKPSWWEMASSSSSSSSSTTGDGDDDSNDNNQPSVWNRVYEIPGGNWRGMGVVQLDAIPDLEAEYGVARVRGLKVPPGSVAFRFLADDKGTRNLTFNIFQQTAAIFAIFFDAVVGVILQLWDIAVTVADFLFTNLETFFSDAISFVANVFNEIWAEFLGLPCLKFDSIEVFAISMLDCICGPLTQAIQNLSNAVYTKFFPYTRPNNISELPQAILNCVGLGCLDFALLVSDGPAGFITDLLGNCAGLPDFAVCCVVNPLQCFTVAVMELSDCPCASGSSPPVPPDCSFGNNSSDRWLRCIVIWIINNMGANIGACDINGCPGVNSLAGDFIRCLAMSILRIDDFIDAILSAIGGILGGSGIPVDNDIIRAPPVEDGIFSNDLKREAEIEIRYYDNNNNNNNNNETGVNRGLTPAENNGSWDTQVQQQQPSSPQGTGHYKERREDLGGINGGYGRVGVAYPKIQAAIVKARYRRNAIRNSSSSMATTATATTTTKLVETASQLDPEYGEDGVDMVMQLATMAWQKRSERFYRDADPSQAELDLMAEQALEEQRRGTYGGQPMLRQLSLATNPASKIRHRAKLQARVDRRLFSNPYIRVATGRLVEIVRDLTDFAEYRIYGPDPFVLPPEDADQKRDARVHAKRYVDEAQGQSGAYAFYKEAVLDSPYYAGLYKMLFQIGDVKAVGRDSEDDPVWEAMASHADSPLFHMGRIMAASRQLAYAYTVVLNEVYWDPDTFGFHFPNYPQIRTLMWQSHLSSYCDDLRAAISGLFRSESKSARQTLMERATRFVDETEIDPELAVQGVGGIVQSYSWLVQTQVAIHSVAARLLSPKHLEPVLDELATRSPLHARYAYRMKRRVRELRETSDRKHQTLNDRIAAWRRQQGSTMENKDGETVNRPLIDLDPEVHPEAGNRTLVPGERVRFSDGHTGVYLGTMGSKTPRSPTAMGGGGMGSSNWRQAGVGLDTRAFQIGAVLKAVVKVVQFVMNNWKLIASGFMTIVTSPWGRVFWESWFQFIYRRIVRPLYSEGLRGIFGSFFDVLILVFDFQILNETIWFFLINELLRYLLCFAWIVIIIVAALPFVFMAKLLSFGLLSIPVTILLWSLIAIAFAFPYCPPEQVLIDNKITQIFPQYLDDILKCFGDPDLGDLAIGKAVYNGICSVKTDCPGNAPCICENKGGQYSSAFSAFVDDTPCGTSGAPTGQCLCWPKIDCQFLFPRIASNNLFDVDCSEMYGYRINEITWYQTSDYLQIFVNAYNNFWISLRYITRILTGAPGINPLLFMLLIGVGFLVLFYANLYAGLVIIVGSLTIEYGLPIWSNLTIDHIIPGLTRVVSNSPWPISNLGRWFLRFLRFPSFSDGNPLGTPGPAEGVCWIFNMGTLFGGGSVTFFFWATILALLWYGLGPIVWFLFNNIMTPVRMIYAPIWLYYQRSRLNRHFNKAKDIIRRAVPSWARRGAQTAGTGLWQVGSSVARNMIPQPPDTRYNRWINRYYPDPTGSTTRTTRYNTQYQYQQQPIVIHGGMHGHGAGTLEYETDPHPIHIQQQQQQQQQQQGTNTSHRRRRRRVNNSKLERQRPRQRWVDEDVKKDEESAVLLDTAELGKAGKKQL